MSEITSFLLHDLAHHACYIIIRYGIPTSPCVISLHLVDDIKKEHAVLH